jgi:hypothetical protein
VFGVVMRRLNAIRAGITDSEVSAFNAACGRERAGPVGRHAGGGSGFNDRL